MSPLARHFLTRLGAASNSRTKQKSWIHSASSVSADLVLTDRATQESQHRDLNELDCDPKANRDTLNRLVPILAWRVSIAVSSTSLEVVHTQGQHRIWERLDQ